MPTKQKTVEEPKVSGTLDIGAGDRPIPQATVAADINIPTKPKRKPFKRKIKVIVDKTAEGALGLPLKLQKSSRLRIYWAGDAKDLPDEWEGQFSTVYSNSAVGVFGELSTKPMGKELASMLKASGKVKIIANADAARTQKGQDRNNERQIKRVRQMLKAGGFKNIEVKGDYSRGEFVFTAEKPKTPLPVARLPRRKIPRITPKTPRLRR